MAVRKFNHNKFVKFIKTDCFVETTYVDTEERMIVVMTSEGAIYMLNEAIEQATGLTQYWKVLDVNEENDIVKKIVATNDFKAGYQLLTEMQEMFARKNGY